MIRYSTSWAWRNAATSSARYIILLGPTLMYGRGTVPRERQRSTVDSETPSARLRVRLLQSFGISVMFLVGMLYIFSSLSCSVSIGTVPDGCTTGISVVAIGYAANGSAARAALMSCWSRLFIGYGRLSVWFMSFS